MGSEVTSKSHNPVMICVAAAMLFAAGCDRRGSTSPAPAAPATRPTTQADVIRIGLVPEQNIFKLHAAYDELAAYLSEKLGQPVKAVTLNTYENVLRDFEEKQVDAAFLGSLVSVLAMDRYGARVLLKPEQANRVSSYRGLILVREDTPIQSVEQLRGKSLAVVRTTYAGALFPVAELVRRGMYGSADAPKLVAAGTHDEAIAWLVAGRVDAAAVKDLRLEAYQAEHPAARFRTLTSCAPVPNNALVIRGDLAERLGPLLVAALKGMENDSQAKPALAALGAVRFVPCSADEYAPLFEMIRTVGPAWDAVGAAGAPPTSLPARRQ
jgi:phosphonate transport system substrate-binding protein